MGIKSIETFLILRGLKTYESTIRKDMKMNIKLGANGI